MFTPAEPAMGNFASPVGATLVLDAAEKWACLIRYCNNATFHSRHSATGDSRQRPLCAPEAVVRQRAAFDPQPTLVSATGQHPRPCDQSMFSMRSRAFAQAPQHSCGQPDLAGNVEKADLLRTRVVERMNRLGGRLQQNRATLLRKIRLSFRRQMHIAHLAGAEN